MERLHTSAVSLQGGGVVVHGNAQLFRSLAALLQQVGLSTQFGLRVSWCYWHQLL